MSIGFVGLGSTAGEVARRLSRDGDEIVDRRLRVKIDPFAHVGGSWESAEAADLFGGPEHRGLDECREVAPP